MTYPVTPPSQLTLNLEPSVVDRWESLRGYVNHLTGLQMKHAKTIAADMDLSPTVLSKKLHQNEGDGNRFTCDDLEAWISATGAVQPVIEYLATKFAPGGDAARKARAIARLEALATTLETALGGLREPTR